MKHINQNLRVLKRRIMLRVWYSYLISLLISRFTFAGVVLSVSALLSIKVFSLTNLILNLLDVKLGSLPNYIWEVFVSTLMRGELIKVLVFTMSALSFLYLFFLLKNLHPATRSTMSA